MDIKTTCIIFERKIKMYLSILFYAESTATGSRNNLWRRENSPSAQIASQGVTVLSSSISSYETDVDKIVRSWRVSFTPGKQKNSVEEFIQRVKASSDRSWWIIIWVVKRSPPSQATPKWSKGRCHTASERSWEGKQQTYQPDKTGPILCRCSGGQGRLR